MPGSRSFAGLVLALAVLSGCGSTPADDAVRQPVDLECVVEAPSFGPVGIGRVATRNAIIRNDSEYEWAVELGALEPAGGPWSVEYQPGIQKFAPGESLVLPVTFLSSVEGHFEALLPFVSGPCGAGIRLEATAARQMVEVPERVDFGLATPGYSSRRTITIRNPHSHELKIVSIKATAAAFRLANEAPAFIAAQGETSFEVVFTPQAPHDYSASLILDLDDRGTNWTQSIELSGSGGAARLEIEGTLDFHSVLVGARAVRTLRFTNVGHTPLRFETIAAEGTVVPALPFIEEGSGGFELAEIRGMPEGGLEPGESGQLRVAFTAIDGLQQGTLVIRSNDPAEPERRVRLAGFGYESGASPCRYEVATALDFGEVLETSSSTRELVVRNIGTAGDEACLIQHLALEQDSEGAFSFAGEPNVNVRLFPGESWSVPLRFRPRTSGPHGGELELLIGGSQAPVATVELTGRGYRGGGYGSILVAPSDTDFGTLAVGCASRERALTIYNLASNPVTFDRIAVEAGAPSFTLVSHPPLPHVLAAGQSFEIRVKFQPTESVHQQAAIEFTVGGETRPSFAELVSGRGAARSTQTDRYERTPGPRLRVLAIVDDGWTMTSKKALVRENLKALVRSLVAIDADWKLAVTTTSVCASGCANGRFLPLDGPPARRILTAATPEPEHALELLLDEVGDTGQALSQPLEAFHLATNDAALAGHNAGFLQSETSLHVYFVTDTADHSSRPVEFYKALALQTLQAHALYGLAFMAAHPIGTPDATCSYRTPNVDYSRLSQLVSVSNAEVDICRDEWNFTYARLDPGSMTKFFLTNRVDLAKPLTVVVDGVVVPPTNSLGEIVWRYDEQSNSVIFEPEFALAPRAKLDITYTPPCLQ